MCIAVSSFLSFLSVGCSPLWYAVEVEETKVLIAQTGAIPLLVRLLGEADAMGRTYAAGTLQNLARE